MQKVERFLSNNPSYVKCSVKRIANRLKLSEKTVMKFRTTETYKNIRQNYLMN